MKYFNVIRNSIFYKKVKSFDNFNIYFYKMEQNKT